MRSKRFAKGAFAATTILLGGWAAVQAGCSSSAFTELAEVSDASADEAAAFSRADANPMIDARLPISRRDGAEEEDAGIDAASPCGPSVDFTQDAQNCGTCGHDCLGGACSAGECMPFVIAQGQADAQHMAVSGNFVFWTATSQSQVRRCPKSGCVGDAGAFAVSQPFAIGITADPRFVYFSAETAGRIVRADPVSAAQVTFLDKQSRPALMTGDKTDLYWLNLGTAGQVNTSTLVKLSKDGGAPVVIAPGLDGLLDIALNTKWVYFTTAKNEVRACELPDCAGGPVDLVVAGSSKGLSGLTADDNFVYWTATVGANVTRCAAAGCGQNPETIAQSQNGARSIVVDGAMLYWADRGAGTIVSCPIATCGTSVKQIASGQSNPTALVVDKDAVYWLNSPKAAIGDAGAELASVMKVAK